MQRNDLILISVDDHVIEPPDVFANHLPAKYMDRAPKMVRRAEDADVWEFGDLVLHTSALAAVAGRPKTEYGLDPQSRPGAPLLLRRRRARQGHERGRRSRRHELPHVPTFTGRTFLTDDRELSLALVQAYNDWHIDEWCGAYPGCFIPMAIPAIWDVDATAQEVRRCAEKGCHSLSFSENPASLGYPSFHDDYWDPLWNAVCDTGTVLSIHLGSSGKAPHSHRGWAAGRDDHAPADERRLCRG